MLHIRFFSKQLLKKKGCLSKLQARRIRKKQSLFNIFTDFDNGDAFKTLLTVEQQLFQNNFPQVVVAHAVSSIIANYDLVVEEFDRCSVPDLQGQPVSGKTTAMRAVLSVFGETKFSGGKYEKKN